jgi:hypothetical protein
MSAFQRPRASFCGVFTTNTPTANNDKNSITMDEENARLLNPPNAVTPPYDPKTPLNDDIYRRLMMQLSADSFNPPNPAPVLNSYFNYFGDSSMSFEADPAAGMPYSSTLMTSSVLRGGRELYPSGDVFLTGQVKLLGHLRPNSQGGPQGSAKMVDLDPIGAFATQIFSGEFWVADPRNNTPMLRCTNPTRAYIRNMNMDRNITPWTVQPPGIWMGGAIWQLGLPLDGLFFDPSYLPQSPTLSALKAAAQAGKGLLVRFAMYSTVDGMPESKLAQEFQNTNYKQPIQNPATGMLVGSIGAWGQDEPASMPVGRLLLPVQQYTGLPSGNASDISMRDKSRVTQPDPKSGPPPRRYYLGPASVVVDSNEKTVIIDLLTTIPEDTPLSSPPQPPVDLQKADFGDLTLTITSNGQSQTVAVIPYEQYKRSAYESGSGVIEIPYAAALAPALMDPQGVFTLSGQKLTPSPALEEVNYGFVFTDDQCLYLHEGDSVSYQIQVFYKGQPFRNQKVAITTSEYQFKMMASPPPAPPSPGQPQPAPVRVFEPLDNTPGLKYVVSIPPQEVNSSFNSGQPISITNPMGNYVTDNHGKITLTVNGNCRGAAMVRYQLAGDTFDPNMGGANKYLYFGYTFYNAFRVLPNDNYDHISNDQVTWEFVYREVLQYYYLLYPGMFARWDGPVSFKDAAVQNASIIAQMVNKRFWDKSWSMPVSRDISDGKRKLLQRWCALQE